MILPEIGNNSNHDILNELLNKQMEHYNSYDRWEQLDLMQLHLNHAERDFIYVYAIPKVFPRGYGFSDFIEDYAIRKRGGGYSVFDIDYASSISSNYFHLYIGVWEGEYEALDHAERVTEGLREKAINNILND